jgi:negative regulator of sigma E activity
MPLTALETRFGSLEESNRILAAEVHTLTALITEVQGLREAEARTRRRLRWFAVATTIAIAAAALIVFGATLARVNTLIDGKANDTRNVCLARNAQTVALRNRFMQLADAETDTRTRRIYTVLSVELGTTRVDCNQLSR